MLSTDCEFLRPEIMDVLRLFGAGERDFSHTFAREGDKFINTVECGGNKKTFSVEWHAATET